MNKWMREVHRWASITFTLAAIANIVALVLQSQAVWIGFVALLPLVVLLITGLYLFVLPYRSKSRTHAP